MRTAVLISTLHIAVGSLLKWQLSPAFVVVPVAARRMRPGKRLLANIDDLRRTLETAWNAETMGRIPTSAVGAAEASFAALQNALERKETPIFFVDVLLPKYDVSAGSNIYDKMLSVDFCIAFAELLHGRTEILVRDAKVLSEINRILDAREGKRISEMIITPALFRPPEPKFGEMGRQLGAGTGETASKNSSLNGSDVIADAEVDKSSPAPLANSDVESFRELLLMSWEATGDLDGVREHEGLNDGDEDSRITLERPRQKKSGTTATEEKSYRMASLLGDAVISKGPDMVDDVVAAVSANALPKDDEKTLIILSAVTKEELYAVRAVAAKYEHTKTVILINCKLDPIPQELIRAQTIYSILPLLARQPNQESTGPKVVVLRRYPRDWEVYVDIGKGFDLAASMPAEIVNRRSPPFEWLSSAVERYLQNRQG